VLLPALIAGLPLSRAWVKVTPPLLVNGPSSGSLVRGALVNVTFAVKFRAKLLLPVTFSAVSLPTSDAPKLLVLSASTVLLSVMLPPPWKSPLAPPHSPGMLFAVRVTLVSVTLAAALLALIALYNPEP